MAEKHIKKHMHRPDLSGEHPSGDAGQIVLFLLFVGVWIADSFFLKYSTFLGEYILLVLRIVLAIICIAVAAYFAKKGHDVVFGEVKEKPTLLNAGIYTKVRHPIYLGAILFYFGLVLLTFSLFSLGLWLIIFIFYDYIARYEEVILSHTLGESYDSYMNDVPRWIPRFRK